MTESSINSQLNSSISTFDGTIDGHNQITKPKSDKLPNKSTRKSYELPNGAIFEFVLKSRVMILSNS
jgi:hypothetical protein